MDIKKEFNRLLEETINHFSTGFKEKVESALESTLHSPKEDASLTNTEQMILLDKAILTCTKCSLHNSRLNAVPGKGSSRADIVFIGEGPGEMEDVKGEPFVGKAGQLLTKMLASINLKREEVYITNVVKCRPPNNRTPFPEEIQTCFPYLEKQIELIHPLIICCLGGPAAKALLNTNTGISKLRGTIHQFRNYPVFPTYHPAAVLRFPERYKRHVWNDLKMLRDYYKDLRK